MPLARPRVHIPVRSQHRGIFILLEVYEIVVSSYFKHRWVSAYLFALTRVHSESRILSSSIKVYCDCAVTKFLRHDLKAGLELDKNNSKQASFWQQPSMIWPLPKLQFWLQVFFCVLGQSFSCILRNFISAFIDPHVQFKKSYTPHLHSAFNGKRNVSNIQQRHLCDTRTTLHWHCNDRP